MQNGSLALFVMSFLSVSTWTSVVLALGRHERGFLGLIGGWVATAVLAALWQADAIPWLREFILPVIIVWLGAIALLIHATGLVWTGNESGRRPLLCCAVASLVINVAAVLLFLWAATVGPGGV